MKLFNLTIIHLPIYYLIINTHKMNNNNLVKVFSHNKNIIYYNYIVLYHKNIILR